MRATSEVLATERHEIHRTLVSTNMKRPWYLLSLIPAAYAVGCQQSTATVQEPKPQTKQADEVVEAAVKLEPRLAGYRGWKRVTTEAVIVEPAMTTLCLPRPWRRPPSTHIDHAIHVYVNEIGEGSFERGNFAEGTVIVKEKYAVPPDKATGGTFTPAAGANPVLLTVMVKREIGYAPEVGNWEFFMANSQSFRPQKESVDHCISCHVRMPASDFTFRKYSSQPPLYSEFDYVSWAKERQAPSLLPGESRG